jgi:nucleotide-binding universal stress UspA family protein
MQVIIHHAFIREAIMYDRIIVPIQEGAGLDVLDRPRRLARVLGSELTLLHVHRPRQAPSDLEGLTQYRFQHVVESWGSADQAAEAREAEWLGDLADALVAGDPELRVSTRVDHAPLSRCVHSDDEQILAMVPAGLAGDDGLDATAQELIRTCRVPVLLYQPDMPVVPIRRILVALDGSRFAEEGLAPAIDVARATGARLSLVEVVTRHGGLVRLIRPGERTAEMAEQSLREARDRVPPEVGSVEIRVAECGSAAAGIIAEARRGDVDLVAMATHGRGGIRRILLGSVAEQVVRESPVTVLVLRPQALGADVRDAGVMPAPA